jgi:hypothetical protein
MTGDSNLTGPGGPSSGSGLVDELSTRVRLFELPGYLRASLAGEFAAWSAQRRPTPLRDRIIARLSFDGSAAAMAAGLRGGAAVGRELLFACELAEVALHVDDAGGAAVIDGQVLVIDGPAGAPISAELWDADGAHRWTEADDTGSFVFDSVAPGRYRIVLTIGDDEIEFGPVDVGPRG